MFANTTKLAKLDALVKKLTDDNWLHVETI